MPNEVEGGPPTETGWVVLSADTGNSLWNTWATTTTTARPYTVNVGTTWVWGTTVWHAEPDVEPRRVIVEEYGAFQANVHRGQRVRNQIAQERTRWLNGQAHRDRVVSEQLAEQRQAERARRRAEYDLEVERRRAQVEAEHANVRTATERARALLIANLTAQQRDDFENRNYFEVMSNLGRRWRIRVGMGLVANVDLMPALGTEKLASYCAHLPEYTARGPLPTHDNYLGQKIILEHDEQAFVNVANLYETRVSSNQLPQRVPRRLEAVGF